MIRRPPRSTLFPYTRSSDLLRQKETRQRSRYVFIQRVEPRHQGGSDRAGDFVEEAETRERSEEHTSELQSRLHLVCRLLLEKKKNKASEPHGATARPPEPTC